MTDPTPPDDGDGPVNLQEEVDAFVEGAAGLFESLRDVFVKSREDILRGARLGKVRIDVYQLRKDRELLLQQLGEETLALIQAGSLKAADLAATVAKIAAVDAEIEGFEDELGDFPDPLAADEPANEQPTVAAEAKPAPKAKAPAKKKKAATKTKPAATKKPPAKKKS